jgi:hypothetical protein
LARLSKRKFFVVVLSFIDAVLSFIVVVLSFIGVVLTLRGGSLPFTQYITTLLAEPRNLFSGAGEGAGA